MDWLINYLTRKASFATEWQVVTAVMSFVGFFFMILPKDKITILIKICRLYIKFITDVK
jgi:hypothetical protein